MQLVLLLPVVKVSWEDWEDRNELFRERASSCHAYGNLFCPRIRTDTQDLDPYLLPGPVCFHE